MKRREALLTILLAPAAKFLMAQENTSNATHIGSTTWAMSLRMQLADEDGDGITYLEVLYKGKSKKFSAKEIWEALA
jgi:hypothetical protein